jgi:hypothetical protein
VNGALGGYSARLKGFKARFSSPVYMGETLTTKCWENGDKLLIQVSTENALVLNNAVAELN